MLNSKFICPPIHTKIHHREELFATLMEVTGTAKLPQMGAFPHYKLVLLCAPAGYGKTTLLADFATRINIPCCWYVLDNTDRDKMAFIERLLTSIRFQFPDFGRELDSLIAYAIATHAQNGVTAQHFETIIDSLIESMEKEICKRFILILCNYHELNDHVGIKALMDRLLAHLPPHVILIIESRSHPNLNIDSLLLQRAVFGLLSDGLRFNAQEVYDLASQLRYPLSYQDAEQVVAYFEGWITGILLNTRLGVRFGLPLGSQAGGDAPALRVDRQRLFSYLMNEVFKREPERYAFLKDTSILSQMTPVLVNALLDRDDTDICLGYLERNGFFVTQTHNDNYVTHPAVRELLAEELASQHPERYRELHRRAAHFFYQAASHREAIAHALEARDYDLAAQLISEISQNMLVQGYSETIARWIDALPSQTLEEYPQLLLSRANIYLTLYQIDAALPLLDQVVEMLSSSGDSKLDTSHKILAESLIARGFALWFTGEYIKAQEACTRALVLLPEEERVLCALSYQQLGVVTSLLGEYQTGIMQLQQALRLWRQAKNRQTALLHGQLANAYDIIGNYSLSEHHRARAIRTCEHLGDIWGKINNQVGLAVTRMHQGAYPDAEHLLQETLAQARLHHVQRGEAYALVNLGVLYQDLDRFQQALSITEDGLELARRLQERFLINQALINLATNYLLVQDPETALLLVSEVKIDATGSYDDCLRNLVLGSIFLYQHNYEKAYTTLVAVERNARVAKWKRLQIKALIRLAACHVEQGQHTSAIWYMEQGLDLNKQKEYEHLIHMELCRYSILKNLEQTALQQTKALPPVGHPARTQTSLSVPYRRCSTLGFGEPAVLLDGTLITRWRMSRTMELYFLLLESNRPVRKDQIMASLWPDEDEQNDQTLRSTVHYLRKAIGEGCIVSLIGSYTLDLSAVYGDEVWYDVNEFREHALLAKDATANKAQDEAGRAYERMVSLYRGDYLQTCYSDWCIPYRDTLRTAYMQALTNLAHIAWERKDYDECLHHWQQQLSIDNCLEDAHYWIMCCYVRQGKRSMALRQYHQCRETLQRELATTPGEAIEKVYQKWLLRREKSD